MRIKDIDTSLINYLHSIGMFLISIVQSLILNDITGSLLFLDGNICPTRHDALIGTSVNDSLDPALYTENSLPSSLYAKKSLILIVALTS